MLMPVPAALAQGYMWSRCIKALPDKGAEYEQVQLATTAKAMEVYGRVVREAVGDLQALRPPALVELGAVEKGNLLRIDNLKLTRHKTAEWSAMQRETWQPVLEAKIQEGASKPGPLMRSPCRWGLALSPTPES